MSPTRICFIGCGSHARNFIYPALLKVPDVVLPAVCARNAGEAEACRKRHGASRAYDDYREMLETERPDGVIIVGPPGLHHEAGLYCLERGLPFYIEKPPGANLAQATELADGERERGSFGQVGFMMRHSSVIKAVRKIMDRDELGGPRYGQINYYTSGPYRTDEVYGLSGQDDGAFLWRYLLVQGVHPVNLAASFLGKIEGIRSDVQFSGADILVKIQLSDASGALIDVVLHSYVMPGYGNLQFRTEFAFASRAMIVTSGFDSLEYFPSRPAHASFGAETGSSIKWDFAVFGPQNTKLGFESEIAAFVESVRTGRRPETDLADGLGTMRILTAVYENHKITPGT